MEERKLDCSESRNEMKTHLMGNGQTYVMWFPAFQAAGGYITHLDTYYIQVKWELFHVILQSLPINL